MIGKGMLVDLEALAPVRVKETAEGTFLVYRSGEDAVVGTAVYLYRSGVWSCEKHGSTRGNARQDCGHVKAARRHKEAA